MLSIRGRLTSKSKIDKIAALIFLLSVIGLGGLVALAIKGYSEYLYNFYYYGYLVVGTILFLTMINVTRDYINPNDAHKGSFNYFLSKINPARENVPPEFFRILNWPSDSIIMANFAIFILGMMFSLLTWNEPNGDARGMLFFGFAFLMHLIPYGVENIINSVKVSSSILNEIDEIEDISANQKKTLIDNCFSVIKENGDINRNEIMHHLRFIFKSREKIMREEKEEEAKNLEKMKKSEKMKNYESFISKHNKSD